MIRKSIDTRPFQTKAALESQQSLEAQYGRLAIDEVVAALHHIKAAAEARTTPVARAA